MLKYPISSGSSSSSKKMPARAASPAASLSGFDISANLLGDDGDDYDLGFSSLGGDGTAADPAKVRISAAAGARGNLDIGIGNGDTDDDDGDAEFIAATQAASNRKSANVKGRSVKKGGGFQAMGLNANLLKAITRKGFSVPTPIQRKTIPFLLDGKDVVGMARTGSGKTAAFVIPMIEKLKAHSVKVGSRALIMSPSRELALQTLRVVKELGKGTDLKSVLLVGGDSLEEQFGLMASNPDIVIATPGRFLHLKVEMGLDLSSIQYVVFDEADRLFEMGFASQLTEILHGLPQNRQTLLFSATLPKSLVEFARAGLQEPSLVRLDAEGKISPDLQSAFFTVKTADKEGALLHILHDVIRVPTGETPAARQVRENEKNGVNGGKKRKRGNADGDKGGKKGPTEHSTIVFTATKHHVEYISNLLRASGFAISHLYGSLDQTARSMQVQDFRTGLTNILVVTDVAARGVDIPILANVINYDFPPQPKIYVHRVGRTARAGQRGWSYSLVRDSDCPYMLDLQLFLGRKLVLGRAEGSPDFAQDVVVGGLPRDRMERHCEWVNKTLSEDSDIKALREVARKGEKLFMRTRNSASIESAKRAKSMTSTERWSEMHALFHDETSMAEMEREKMLAKISGFRPSETIFEMGKRNGQEEAGEVVKKRREAILKRKLKRELQQAVDRADELHSEDEETPIDGNEDVQTFDVEGLEGDHDELNIDMGSASESELEVTFSEHNASVKSKANGVIDHRDSEHFMSYTPTATNVHEERGYGVHSGGTKSGGGGGGAASFLLGARDATMDLGADEGGAGFAEARGKRWDKRHKKYVSRANDEDGSKGARLVKGESGARIAASFRSGRFDEWRRKNRLDRLPRVGEMESSKSLVSRSLASEERNDGASSGRQGPGSHGSGKAYRHRQDKAPKAADKFRDDYHKKKKQIEAAKERMAGLASSGSRQRKKGELKDSAEVRKERKAKEKRREKTGRASKKGRR